MKTNNFFFRLVGSSLILSIISILNPINTFAHEFPSSTPELFEIRADLNQATLYFTPINNTSTFVISFSTHSHAEEHGEKVNLGYEGVQAHTIYNLAPNTLYYVKIRGQKDDNIGEWSNILAFRTQTQKTAYYLHGNQPSASEKIYSASTSVKSASQTQSVAKETNETTSQSPTPAIESTGNLDTQENELGVSNDVVTDVPTPETPVAPEQPDAEQIENGTITEENQEKKEKCFLWWCW